MKRFVFLITLLIVSFASAVSTTPVEQVDNQYLWQINGDNITAQYGPIAVTALDDANVSAISDDNCITITVDNGWAGIEFDFLIKDGNDGDIDVIEGYELCDSNQGAYYWRHRATLTITQGTMEYSTGIYFADTVVDSNNTFYRSKAVSPTNGIGSFAIETFGAKKYKFVASTLYDSDKIYVHYRRWSR
jgi:hypothetical protein